MSYYLENKRKLQLTSVRDSILSLIDVIRDNRPKYLYDLPYCQYILEARTINLEYFRQIGKTTIMCELFRQNKNTLYVCHNRAMKQHLCDKLGLEQDTRKVVTIEDIHTDDIRLMGINFNFNQILFDECFSKDLFYELVRKYDLSKTDNRDMIVVAMGSPVS